VGQSGRILAGEDTITTRNSRTRPAERRGYNVKKFRDIVAMDSFNVLATSFFLSRKRSCRHQAALWWTGGNSFRHDVAIATERETQGCANTANHA
jgi:hypothetical protein